MNPTPKEIADYLEEERWQGRLVTVDSHHEPLSSRELFHNIGVCLAAWPPLSGRGRDA